MDWKWMVGTRGQSEGVEGERTGRDDWKRGAFHSEVETYCAGNSRESTRLTPVKTPTNEGYIT